MDSGTRLTFGCDNLEKVFSFIFEHGSTSKKEKWSGASPLMRIFSNDFRSVIESLINSSNDRYRVICSTGSSGKWSHTPYCAILSAPYNATVNGFSPSRGIFPAYLLSIDSSEIYLAYMIGVGTKKERDLNNIASLVKSHYNVEGFKTETREMNLGNDIHNYAKATLWFKKYESSNLPPNSVLENDLLDLITFHESNGAKINKISDEIIQARH